MRNLRAIVVDDEAAARQNMEMLLDRFCPQVELLAVHTNLVDAARYLNKNQVDLVFLDVEMPNYAGYEIGRLVDVVNFEIVFVTAYDQYAIRAFELAAIDYLLKPIEIPRLMEAVKRVEERKEAADQSIRLQRLTTQLGLGNEPAVAVVDQGEKLYIKASDIDAIQADGAYSILYTARGSYLVSKNMARIEELLLPFKPGFRAHKSWWVNLQSVERLDNAAYELILKSGLRAKISRQRVAELKTKLGG